MRKKKYYLGKRHVKRFQWLREENRKKVPRMLREYYRLIMRLVLIDEQEKLNLNGTFGRIGTPSMIYMETPSKVDALIEQSIRRRKKIKQAIHGRASIQTLRGILAEIENSGA